MLAGTMSAMAVSLLETTARQYSAEDLLRLRDDLPFVTCIVRKLNKHPDIVGIIKLPEAALNDPDAFSCTSRTLADVTNRCKVTQLGRKQAGENSSEDIEAMVVSSVNLPRDTHRIQWHLRRRENSDRSAQPHSAPSGIAAQQSENFQRFYRAVVSPTHVRVTAGGRIVPNTRATVPPSFEWNKDKLIFEQPKLPSEFIALQPTTWQPVAPVPIGFPSSLPSGFLPTYNTLPQSNNFAQAGMAPQSFASCASDNNAFATGQSKAGADMASESTNNGAPPQPIKISHPSQFDQSKPFVYNGHVVYPLPAGHQLPPRSLPVPLTVLGNPNYVAHQTHATGTVTPQQPPFSMLPLSNPYILHPSTVPNLQYRTESFPHLAPYYPNPGPTTISELTKSQMQGFYSHLKYLDNQIANNKHQIDEGYMAHQRAEVVAAIAKMEAVLKAPLAQQIKPSPLLLQTGSLGRLSNSRRTRGDNSHSGEQRNANRSSTETSALPDDQTSGSMQALFSKPKLIPIQISAPKDQMKSASKTERVSTADASSDAKIATQSEPAAKFKLTAAAAKAPPFQPRTHVVAASNNTMSYPNSEFGSAPLVSHSAAESQVQYPTSWDQSRSGPGVGYEANNSGLQSMQRVSNHSQDGSFSGIFDVSQTFHGLLTTTVAPNSAQLIPPHAVPYLIGVLPQGVNIHDAKATDLVYSRPLTNEEVRARYLYWGKAPRFIQSGLPKFDGKDFYPPSPVKEIAHREPTPLGARGDFHGTSLAFENVVKEQGIGLKTPSPVRAKPYAQDIGATPTHNFLENGVIGFQSPSPRPSTYKYEASHMPGPPIAYGTAHAKHNPPTAGDHGNPSPRLAEDFSQLFMERGEAGYKSPTPPPQSRPNGYEAATVTPNNLRLVREQGVKGVRHGVSVNKAQQKLGDSSFTTSAQPDTDDTASEASTVEINLVSRASDGTANYTNGTSNSGRHLDLTNVDQQSQFLHSMLRNSTQTPMVAPALSGAVSSATAQGYLPQYRGAAAASLAPAAFAGPVSVERSSELLTLKSNQTNGTAPLVASNFLPENRPLNRDRSPRLIRPSPATMGAEGYMRYVSQKADDDKKILRQGWNARTMATGPVMGADW